MVAREEMYTVVGSDRYIGGMIDMGSGHLHPLSTLPSAKRVRQPVSGSPCSNTQG